jgi:hypothetical protein
MGKSAKLLLDLTKLKGDALLYLEGRISTDYFASPSTLRLRLNGQPLGQATTDAKGQLAALYHLTPQQMGPDPTAVVDLEVDQTFVPRRRNLGEDDRTLGLMVTTVYAGPDTELTRNLQPRPQQAAYTPPPAAETAAGATPAATPADAASPAATPAGAASPAAATTPAPEATTTANPG